MEAGGGIVSAVEVILRGMGQIYFSHAPRPFFSFRGSLQNVYFPSVTLCNINQGRHSLFRQMGLSQNNSLLLAVLRQAYFGSKEELSGGDLAAVRRIFSSEEVVRKGILADMMFTQIPYRQQALHFVKNLTDDWNVMAGEAYISDAGWYFKTLAVQEIGEKKKRKQA